VEVDMMAAVVVVREVGVAGMKFCKREAA